MSVPLIYAANNRTEKPDLQMFHMHTHEVYEIYCFISGNAKYFVEGNIYSLRPGDILIMKKAEAHSLLINNCMPYERIVINFNSDALLGDSEGFISDFLDSRPLGKNNLYPASVFKNTNWPYYLKKICCAENLFEKRLYLTVLLNELCENYPKICGGMPSAKDNIIDIINFINARLTENLSLSSICNHFYISKAQINRRFRRMTGSTVWEYILTKRLLMAKELLQSGEAPTNVSEKCGFNDYCSFFRAYKAKFGVSPKYDRNYKK